MVSHLARHILGTLAFICTGSLPGAVLAQAPSERLRADDGRERIAEQLDAAQAAGGPRSPDLIAPLTELGELYETEGEHLLATAALAQARHVVRANYGLYTLEQAPLMEQALKHQQALGNRAMVQALEEELYVLANRHPADVRTVAIHRGIAERKLDLLRRFEANEHPAEIYGESGWFSVYPDEVRKGLVSEAQIHYSDAIAVLLRNGLRSADDLVELEMHIARASDLFRERNRPDGRSVVAGKGRMDFDGDHLGFAREFGVGARERGPGWNVTAEEELKTRANELWDLAGVESSQEAARRKLRVQDMTNRYQQGRESFRRAIAYREAAARRTANEDTARGRPLEWTKQLEAYLQLADWDLLYSANGVAVDAYTQVHEMLQSADAEPLRAEIFSPAVPVVLPAFRLNPLATPVSARYIDAAFEITRYGVGRRIEIIGSSPAVSDAAQADLVKLIKSNRFRPRAVDGALARAAPVVVRYYLSD